MIAYKFLTDAGRGPITDRAWPLPAPAGPGAWIEAAPGPLDPCRNGVHACEPHDLPYWLAAELWRVELDGERIRGPESVIARRGRLVAKVSAWNPATARSFAEQCRTRAEAFVAALPAEHCDRGAQYLSSVTHAISYGRYALSAFASAMAFTVSAPSAAQAFAAERGEQATLLGQLLGL